MAKKPNAQTRYSSATESIASLIIDYVTEYGERHLVMSLMSGGECKDRIDSLVRGAKKRSLK